MLLISDLWLHPRQIAIGPHGGQHLFALLWKPETRDCMASLLTDLACMCGASQQRQLAVGWKPALAKCRDQRSCHAPALLLLLSVCGLLSITAGGGAMTLSSYVTRCTGCPNPAIASVLGPSSGSQR